MTVIFSSFANRACVGCSWPVYILIFIDID
jgi:hypothetical protein